METISVIAAIICVTVCALASIVYNSPRVQRKLDELSYIKAAKKYYDIDKATFNEYMKFARALYGPDATAKDAFKILEEEWYDLNYK